MSKRIIILDDEQIGLVLSWGEVARSASNAATIPDEVIAHDFEDEDQAVYDLLAAARLL